MKSAIREKPVCTAIRINPQSAVQAFKGWKLPCFLAGPSKRQTPFAKRQLNTNQQNAKTLNAKTPLDAQESKTPKRPKRQNAKTPPTKTLKRQTP